MTRIQTMPDVVAGSRKGPAVSVILVCDAGTREASARLGELDRSIGGSSEVILVRSGSRELSKETEALAAQFGLAAWSVVDSTDRSALVDAGMRLAGGDVVVVRALSEVAGRPWPSLMRRHLEAEVSLSESSTVVVEEGSRPNAPRGRPRQKGVVTV